MKTLCCLLNIELIYLFWVKVNENHLFLTPNKCCKEHKSNDFKKAQSQVPNCYVSG